MSRVWCCIRCGRWGTRSFTFAPNDDKARVCANDRACARRAAQGSDEWERRAHADPYCATNCSPGHKHSQCGCTCDHRSEGL